MEKSARLLLYSINTLTRQRDACAPATAVGITGVLSMCANGQQEVTMPACAPCNGWYIWIYWAFEPMQQGSLQGTMRALILALQNGGKLSK